MANSWDSVVGTDQYNKTLDRAKKYADRTDCILNPDGERIEKVIGLMTKNLIASNKYICPCKQSHPLDPDSDVICPCPEINKEMKITGNCFCKLFYTK